jgi:hypothetical protein
METFRPKRSMFRLGLCFLMSCPFILVISVLGWYFEAPPEEGPLWLLGVAVACSFYAGIGIWMMLTYRRVSVTVGQGTARISNLIGERLISVHEVRRACWHRQPPSLKLFTASGTWKLQLDEFCPSHRKQLIRFFRDSIDSQMQERWTEAIEHDARIAESQSSQGEYRRFFRRLLRWCFLGPILGLLAAIAINLYARSAGAVYPSGLTGSILFDGPLFGLIAGLLLAAFLLVFKWIDEPGTGSMATSQRPNP